MSEQLRLPFPPESQDWTYFREMLAASPHAQQATIEVVEDFNDGSRGFGVSLQHSNRVLAVVEGMDEHLEPQFWANTFRVKFPGATVTDNAESWQSMWQEARLQPKTSEELQRLLLTFAFGYGLEPSAQHGPDILFECNTPPNSYASGDFYRERPFPPETLVLPENPTAMVMAALRRVPDQRRELLCDIAEHMMELPSLLMVQGTESVIYRSGFHNYIHAFNREADLPTTDIMLVKNLRNNYWYTGVIDVQKELEAPDVYEIYKTGRTIAVHDIPQFVRTAILDRFSPNQQIAPKVLSAQDQALIAELIAGGEVETSTAINPYQLLEHDSLN